MSGFGRGKQAVLPAWMTNPELYGKEVPNNVDNKKLKYARNVYIPSEDEDAELTSKSQKSERSTKYVTLPGNLLSKYSTTGMNHDSIEYGREEHLMRSRPVSPPVTRSSGGKHSHDDRHSEERSQYTDYKRSRYEG